MFWSANVVVPAAGPAVHSDNSLFQIEYIAALVLVVIFGIALVGVLRKNRATGNLLDDLKKELTEEDVILSGVATFVGRSSFGPKQAAGTGALVLTARQLVFQMIMPKRRLAVSMHSVTGAKEPKAQGGKVSLLEVGFHDEKAGVDDAAVWVVPNPADWALQINAAQLRATRGATRDLGGIAPWERGD